MAVGLDQSGEALRADANRWARHTLDGMRAVAFEQGPNVIDDHIGAGCFAGTRAESEAPSSHTYSKCPDLRHSRFTLRRACFSTLATKTEHHAAQTAERMRKFAPHGELTRGLTCIEFAAFHLRRLRNPVHGMALAPSPSHFLPARGVERKPW